MSAAEYFQRIEQALQRQPYQLELLTAWAQFGLKLERIEPVLKHLEKIRHAAEMANSEAQTHLCLLLGNVYFESGDYTNARKVFLSAINLNQKDEFKTHLLAGLWNNLGQCQHRMHQLDAAEASYQQALLLNLNLIEAHSNLSALYLDLGQTSQARKILNQAFSIRQDYAPAWVNLGILEGLTRNQDAALNAFEQARRLEPTRSEVWLESAFLLIQQKKYLQAQTLCQEALLTVMHTEDLTYLSQRLDLLQQQTSPLKSDPAAISRRQFRQLQQAIGWSESHFLDSGTELNAYLAELLGILESWQGRGFEILDLIPEFRFVPELLFGLLYVGEDSHRQIRQAFAALFQTETHTLNQRATRKKLKIGVQISPGHEGIFKQLGWPLIQYLQEQFEWVLIGDSSRLQTLGFAMVSFINHLGTFVHRIRSQQFDLLYFWEVGSDCINYFLPFFRLAPVQFVSWGMPMTSGIPSMDYMISSAFAETLTAQQDYTETLLLHPGLPSMASTQNYESYATRQQLNLPADRVLYVCMQNPLKYCLGFIDALKNIARQDSDALLVLLASDKTWVQHRVATELAEVKSQIHWIQTPISDQVFCSFLKVADLVLDTHKVSGGQTADQTLLLGSPLLTYPGKTARSRLSLARLKAIGNTSGVCKNWQDFTNKAGQFAHQGQLRQQYLQQIQNTASTRLQHPAFAVDFAHLIELMATQKGIL